MKPKSVSSGYKRKYVSKAKSTRSVAYSSQNSTGVSVPRSLRTADPFPKQMVAVHKWAELLTFQTAVGTKGQCGVENVWNLNGLFDPDLSGGTHQPYEFDQMASIYSRNCVLKVEWEFTMLPGASVPDNLCLAILPQGDSTFGGLAGLALSDVVEKTGAQILPLACTGYPTKQRGKVDLATLIGLTKEQYIGQDRFNGTSTANPSSPSYLRVAIANMNTTTTRTIDVMCRLQFYVIWFDRIINSASN